MSAAYPVKRNASLLLRSLRNKRLLPAASAAGFRVLLYHAVGPDPGGDALGLRIAADDFYAQMSYLEKEGWQVLRIRELVENLIAGGPPRQKCLGISFDDGYKDNLTNAMPVLEKFGFPATVFMRADALGGIRNKSGYWENWDHLSGGGIKEMVSSGLIDIGSHTISHPKLSRLDADALKMETSGSRSILEDLTGRPVDLFSYPFGHLDRRVKEASRSAGYMAAFSSFIGINGPGADRFELKRTEMVSSDGAAGLEMKLDGSYDWLYYLQKMRKRGLM